MGNSPSTSKAATPTSSGNTSAVAHDSPRTAKSREPKNFIHQHHPRAAVSPEATVVEARGSTISNRNSQSRPLSILTSSSPSNSVNAYPPPPPSRSFESKSRPPPEHHDEPSKPVDVPVSTTHPETSLAHDSQYEESILTSGPASSSMQDMSYHMSRPPRLPLPIEEEIHTPGSPIIAPADVAEPIGTVSNVSSTDDQSNLLTRRGSGLSNATDEDDSEELRVDKTRPTVPTRVEWTHGGQKVYVTGTPFQWSRKQRLHPAKGREGVLETVIPVFPGTHHIKFLVDGNMQTSTALPTTVDFGNNLVNYIEVIGDEASAAPKTLAPDMAAPKSNEEAQALVSRHPSATQLDEQAKKSQTKSILPAENFTEHLPAYLTDFDQPEETQAYRLSTMALEKLPTPPTLPGFLTKPILNNTSLLKDDNSVLNMPNHTVLNHLGTSSIKNNVLGVSATTRYRNKYVTTIIYKPTSD